MLPGAGHHLLQQSWHTVCTVQLIVVGPTLWGPVIVTGKLKLSCFRGHFAQPDKSHSKATFCSSNPFAHFSFTQSVQPLSSTPRAQSLKQQGPEQTPPGLSPQQ